MVTENSPSTCTRYKCIASTRIRSSSNAGWNSRRTIDASSNTSSVTTSTWSRAWGPRWPFRPINCKKDGNRFLIPVKKHQLEMVMSTLEKSSDLQYLWKWNALCVRMSQTRYCLHIIYFTLLASVCNSNQCSYAIFNINFQTFSKPNISVWPTHVK